MAEENEKSVLKRMAGARAVKVGPTAMTVEKALRISMAKAGNEVLDTAIGLRSTEQGTHVPEGLTDFLPETGLYVMLKGPVAAVGVAIVCPQIVAAVIEAATMGKVIKREAADRQATATDAALTSVFLNHALESFGILAQECYPPMPFKGYKCDAMLPDGRAAQMVLADAAHRRITIELDFALGAKSGKMSFVLPEELLAMPNVFSTKEDWSKNLEKVVLESSANLEAVLCSMSMPLADIREFKVDQIVPLRNGTVETVQMHGPDGSNLMPGTLGRSGAMRAVKIKTVGPSATIPPHMMEANGIKHSAPPPAAAPNDGLASPLPNAATIEAQPLQAPMDGLVDANPFGDLAEGQTDALDAFAAASSALPNADPL